MDFRIEGVGAFFFLVLQAEQGYSEVYVEGHQRLKLFACYHFRQISSANQLSDPDFGLLLIEIVIY